MENLLSVEFKSLAEGYRFLNSLDRFNNIEVIEAASLSAGQFWLLLLGDPSQLSEIYEKIYEESDKQSIRCAELLGAVSPSVRSALYSLELQPVQSYLGIAECESVTSSLKLAKSLTTNGGCQLIEISNGRGMNGHSVIYFTGVDEESAKKTLNNEKKNLKLSHFETISPVGERLKEYFNSFGSDT